MPTSSSAIVQQLVWISARGFYKNGSFVDDLTLESFDRLISGFICLLITRSDLWPLCRNTHRCKSPGIGGSFYSLENLQHLEFLEDWSSWKFSWKRTESSSRAIKQQRTFVFSGSRVVWWSDGGLSELLLIIISFLSTPQQSEASFFWSKPNTVRTVNRFASTLFQPELLWPPGLGQGGSEVKWSSWSQAGQVQHRHSVGKEMWQQIWTWIWISQKHIKEDLVRRKTFCAASKKKNPEE